jgi:hypothetical protein
MINYESSSCSIASSRHRIQANHQLTWHSHPTNTFAADDLDVSELSDDVLQEQLIIAEREAMDAKAEYELRNRITHNVLIMDPILKAVHGGERTEHAEK